ncbi:hypothetical protein [Myroides injenensis]|uniref:hypothetical protein n=1 Tax=Myroides injenensis TaxID=1183151 RepID=UPI0002880BA6|nr:hypothetical protein [Myroides injenensis]
MLNYPYQNYLINVDAGFDLQKLIKIVSDKEIIANLYPNKRNRKDYEHNYFDEKLCKVIYTIESRKS